MLRARCLEAGWAQADGRPQRCGRAAGEPFIRTAGQHGHQVRRKQMSDDKNRELSQEELEAQEAAELPDREAMSLVNANVAAPINAALALNVLSDNSVAYANAQQTAPITQSTT